MNRRTQLVSLLVACGALASSVRAEADGTSTELTATALFDEGRKLMAEKRYADACPKLAESERLAPSGGTLINLAGCYEHTEQTASAWVTWRNVAARANAAGKADAEASALAHAAALEPWLAKLTIALGTEGDFAGLEVKRDGVVVGHAEFGLPIPVDPGVHVVEATGPMKKLWRQQVEVAPRQTDAHVTLQLILRPRPLSRRPRPRRTPLPPSTSLKRIRGARSRGRSVGSAWASEPLASWSARCSA
jgi:hypothetical protein